MGRDYDHLRFWSFENVGNEQILAKIAVIVSSLHMDRDSDALSTPLAEVAVILAVGLQRLLRRKSSHLSPSFSENPLDCGVVIEGHIQQMDKELTP